ncbi:hypothetical protein Gpo141_00000811 [Globisporangium polare]
MPEHSSFGEVMLDTHLASVGPSVPSVPSLKAQAERRTTEAWSDEQALAAAYQQTAPTTAPIKRKPIQRLALCIVFIQALWAIVVPIKNIATVYYPSTRPDSTRTSALPYEYEQELPSVFPGKDLVPLFNEVLDITLSNYAVRSELEASGTFDIDRIYSLIALDEFAAMSQYYALVLQSSEFPGATLTPRDFSPAAANEKLSVLLRRSAGDNDMGDIEIDLACAQESAFMKASRCTGSDGYPCVGDTPQEGEKRTFEDVDLHTLSNNSGLENNVGLLFMVDFFHQAMSTLFAAKDWTAALETLNYVQLADEALDIGSLSSYKDNTPYLSESDAFLVAVQAAQMETTQLSSCVASELVVGQFYTRTFILNIIQSALVSFDLFDGVSEPIVVPSTTDAVLKPIFAFDLHVTSGAQSGKIQVEHTNFLKHFRMGSLTMVTSQLKLDHAFSSATQVTGSSMRMLQAMAFFPDILSVFDSDTKGSGSSAYDYQNYKLIGATGSGINAFKDSSTGANTWMVYPMAEIGTSEAPADSWWDEAQEYASWFQEQEADMSTAPFRVFNDHLSISSTLRITPADDNNQTRCHRALFKVLGKVAYLALVGLSKPTSYLMFMSEVSVDHRTWLLNQVFAEELVGENFFGDRVAFPYRSGAFTRKDDGSAWVVIPMLNAMIEHFGASETLTTLLQELDRSFTDFVKASNGDLQFPDAASCHVSGLSNAATGQAAVVSAGDKVSDIYGKIYPGLEGSLTDLLALIPDLNTKMSVAMASRRIYMVTFTSDQIVGTPVVTELTEGYGPPNYWQPTAFTAGLRKFWPPKTPLKATVQQMRAASHCYRMLELRYLNTTTRCFAEPNSVKVLRRAYASEAMRKFFMSLWSMAVMLNTMAWVVVIKYLEKLLKAWRVTRFECLDVHVALQLNLQGLGVLNISQSLLLLVATLPALIGFHLPRDSTFVLPQQDGHLPKVAVDVLVTMSMSWFVKLGFEFSNNRISPKRPADWYHQFRLRWFVLALIFVLRLLAPEKRGHDDGSYQMWKLVLTCVLSLLLGTCVTCVVFLPERRGKVTAGDRKEGHDAVLAALVKQNLPLNRYGVLGRTSRGWSTTGLIVGGWKLAGRSENGDQVLRKGAGEILLPKESGEEDNSSSSVVQPQMENEVETSEVEGAFEASKVPSPMTM